MPDHPVMEFQQEASAGLRKRITIGDMMVAEFFFLPITLGFQEGFCFFEGFRFVDVEIEITEFPVLRHRVAGSETDALEKNTGDAVFLKKRDCVPGEGIDLIVIQHHIFRFLQHRGIERKYSESQAAQKGMVRCSSARAAREACSSTETAWKKKCHF